MMNKKIIFALGITTILLLSGCTKDEIVDKKQVTMTTGTISQGIVIGKELAPFTIKDQFDKEYSLDASTKKVIFAFSNITGQLIKGFMASQKPDYLTSRNILYIADISGMPSIISKMFAIPSMKDDIYPILLIKEKDEAIRFRNEKQKDAVMIISLENEIIKNVKFVTNETDLKNEIQ